MKEPARVPGAVAAHKVVADIPSLLLNDGHICDDTAHNAALATLAIQITADGRRLQMLLRLIIEDLYISVSFLFVLLLCSVADVLLDRMGTSSSLVGRQRSGTGSVWALVLAASVRFSWATVSSNRPSLATSWAHLASTSKSTSATHIRTFLATSWAPLAFISRISLATN